MIPFFDLTKLRGISRGSVEFVANMVQLFIEKTPPVLQQLDDAWAQRDLEALAGLAHRLKTSVSIMSIPSVDNDLQEPEELPGKRISEAAIITHITHLKSVVEEVIRQLEHL